MQNYRIAHQTYRQGSINLQPISAGRDRRRENPGSAFLRGYGHPGRGSGRSD